MEHTQLIQSLSAIIYMIMQPISISPMTSDLLWQKFETCVEMNTNETQSIYEHEQMRLDCVPENRTSLDSLSVGGWIPNWDYVDGTETVKKNSGLIKRVSPFWYELKADGSITKLSGYNYSELRNLRNQYGIEITPSITSFNANNLKPILNDPAIRQYHIDVIVSEVLATGVDGIDLDYEDIYSEDKESFFEFLGILKNRLEMHQKKLIFTAHAKWGTFVHYTGYTQTRKVQDYKRISDTVDELRIMAYEYTGRKSTVHGPNAPLDWLEDIIRYAISEGVPREKLVLGLPLYSYDYIFSNSLETMQFYPRLQVPYNPEMSETAYAYYNDIIDAVRREYLIYSDIFNPVWGESILAYRFKEGDRDEDRFIVYPNQQTVQLRKELATKYGIKGIYYWKLGDEGSLGL
jgi:spore germination protein YaaH